MVRIVIQTGDEVGEALIHLASYERRTIQAQARLIIRKELERRGLLNPRELNRPASEHSTEEQKSPVTITYPTVAEQLESLIRRIAREVLNGDLS